MLESDWLRLSFFEHFSFLPEIRLEGGIVKCLYTVRLTLLLDVVLERILNSLFPHMINRKGIKFKKNLFLKIYPNISEFLELKRILKI